MPVSKDENNTIQYTCKSANGFIYRTPMYPTTFLTTTLSKLETPTHLVESWTRSELDLWIRH